MFLASMVIIAAREGRRCLTTCNMMCRRSSWRTHKPSPPLSGLEGARRQGGARPAPWGHASLHFHQVGDQPLDLSSLHDEDIAKPEL